MTLAPSWAEHWTSHPFPTRLIEPRKRFDIIYADPPWGFKSWSAKGEGRSASRHYRVMPLEQIMALPVEEVAAKDSVLFMWVIRSMIPHALQVIDAWGFTFKTVGFVWVKIKGKQDRLFYGGEDVRMGLGKHTRAGAEQCWIATRGRGYGRKTFGEPEVVFDTLREHSRKPDSVRDAIVRLAGDRPRVELFARQAHPGWEAWGDETRKFNGGDHHANDAAAR